MTSPGSSSPQPPRPVDVDAAPAATDADADAAGNLEISVKNVAGDTTSLSVPSTTSIATLKSLLSLRSPSTLLPSDKTRLVFAGKHLSTPSATLADYHIPTNSVLHLALPLRGGTMPPKKTRCSFKDCKERAQPIVGDCGFCQGNYCGRHRLLESHACDGLEDCKKESKERNAEKLNTERTAVVKGV